MLVLLLVAGRLVAGEIAVQQASSRLVENNYYLDANIAFVLQEEVLDALDHGVELNVDIIIMVKIKRRWLRDSLYKKDTIRFKLEYQPLTDVYIVTNLGKPKQRQFRSLAGALQHIGTVDGYFLLNSGNISSEPGLVGLVRAALNVKNLPPPLKTIGLLSGKWQADSDWWQWTIRP